MSVVMFAYVHEQSFKKAFNVDEVFSIGYGRLFYVSTNNVHVYLTQMP